MKLIEILAQENFFAAAEVEALIQSVRAYLNEQSANQARFLAARSFANLTSGDITRFLRDQEREENIAHILQSLILFLEKKPVSEGDGKISRQPERRLREFMRFEADLLNERDVRKAIFLEYGQPEPLKAGADLSAGNGIDEVHRELMAALAENTYLNGSAAVAHLCRVLEMFCAFWFEVCGEDVRRARSSDVFIFKLARILQERLAAGEKADG